MAHMWLGPQILRECYVSIAKKFEIFNKLVKKK